MDALWEKYRSLSPYHYAANDPLRLKDPSGDTVKFTRANDVPAESTELAKEDYRKLKSSEGPVSDAVSGLEQSRHVHRIHIVSSGGDQVVKQSPENAYRQGVGSGTVYLYPVTRVDVSPDGNVSKTPSFVIMSHEMGHMYLADQGKSTPRSVSADHDPNLPKEEQNVILNFENPTRAEFGYPPRETYNNSSVVKPVQGPTSYPIATPSDYVY